MKARRGEGTCWNQTQVTNEEEHQQPSSRRYGRGWETHGDLD